MYLTYHKGSNFDSLMIIAAGANAELERAVAAEPAPEPFPECQLFPATTPDPYQDLIDAANKPNQNDCLLVATEAYARLQKSAYWAKIAGFTWFENAKDVGGHAVVFYQPTADSNIWMYG